MIRTRKRKGDICSLKLAGEQVCSQVWLCLPTDAKRAGQGRRGTRLHMLLVLRQRSVHLALRIIKIPLTHRENFL